MSDIPSPAPLRYRARYVKRGSDTTAVQATGIVLVVLALAVFALLLISNA